MSTHAVPSIAGGIGAGTGAGAGAGVVGFGVMLGVGMTGLCAIAIQLDALIARARAYGA